MRTKACIIVGAFAVLALILTGALRTQNDAEAAWSRTTPELALPGMPLDQAIDRLSTIFRAKIVVNWKALRAGGVSRDMATQPLNLRNASLGTALYFLLDGCSLKNVILGAAVQDGEIRVSTADDLDKYVIVRVYDVRGIPDRDLINGDAITGTRSHDWASGGGTVGAFRSVDGRLLVANRPRVHERVATLIDELRHPGTTEFAGHLKDSNQGAKP